MLKIFAQKCLFAIMDVPACTRRCEREPRAELVRLRRAGLPRVAVGRTPRAELVRLRRAGLPWVAVGRTPRAELVRLRRARLPRVRVRAPPRAVQRRREVSPGGGSPVF